MSGQAKVQGSGPVVEHTEDCPAERGDCTCGGYVPRSVADALADALAEIKKVTAIEDSGDVDPRTQYRQVQEVEQIARQALAAYRAGRNTNEETG